MIVAIIQARTRSTRLPHKIFLKSLGKTMLEHMLERVKRAKHIQKIVIATSTNNTDDEIENFCLLHNLNYVRGPENDVLSRFYMASKKFKAKIIVRLTSDNPLIDPFVIDKVITTFQKDKFDFVSNYVPFPRTYPDGMAVEVFSSKVLKNAFLHAKKPSEREHVTFFTWKQPKKYRIFRVDYHYDISKYRFTLDYKVDFEVINNIIKSLYPKNPNFSLEDIIQWLKKNPEIANLNSHIPPNLGWEKSLEEDRKKESTLD